MLDDDMKEEAPYVWIAVLFALVLIFVGGLHWTVILVPFLTIPLLKTVIFFIASLLGYNINAIMWLVDKLKFKKA